MSGQLCEASCWKKQPGAPVSCGLSACRHLLVGPSFPAASRSWAFLAVGLPGVARTSTGFPRSAQPETRPARVPPVPRGHGVPTAGLCSPAAVAASQRQALPPALHPIARGLRHEASTGVSLSLTRPVFPLPVAPVWGGRPWASPPMLRTPPLPATHVRVGTDHEHFSGAHRRLHPVPPIGALTRGCATSCRKHRSHDSPNCRRTPRALEDSRAITWRCALRSMACNLTGVPSSAVASQQIARKCGCGFIEPEAGHRVRMCRSGTFTIPSLCCWGRPYLRIRRVAPADSGDVKRSGE